MRNTAALFLYEEMKKNDNIFILTSDLGYGLWDTIANYFPDTFYNVGSAEQCMLGIAAGLAYTGKIPVCYSITPFLLYRPAEFIRLYMHHEQLPIKLIGSGRDKDYGHDGFTHWDDGDYIENVDNFRPETRQDVVKLFPAFLYTNKPSYLNLRR